MQGFDFLKCHALVTWVSWTMKAPYLTRGCIPIGRVVRYDCLWLFHVGTQDLPATHLRLKVMHLDITR
jgi:hypothetical protein